MKQKKEPTPKKKSQAYRYLAVWSIDEDKNLINAEVIFCGDRESVLNAVIQFVEHGEYDQHEIENCLMIFKVGSPEKVGVTVITEPQYEISF